MTLELNRAYNMDCLDGMKEIPDKSIDLIITDPPYGIGENNEQNLQRGTSSQKWKRGKARDYGTFDWDKIRITTETIEEVIRISKNQIVFGGNYYSDVFPQSTCWIVWNKENSGDFADCELAWTSFPSAVRMFTYRWNGFIKEHPEERFHPTQKPVKLFEWIIKNYAKEGDIICDPFFGSGSCLVAAIRMGYPFIGFEKEKVYFDAAQIRIKKAQEQGKISGWFTEAVA